LEAGVRVDAQGEALLLISESVLEPPPLTASGRDFQVHAAAIGQLVGFGFGFGGADRGVCQRHGGNLFPSLGKEG
jgi:hypothetical protein